VKLFQFILKLIKIFIQKRRNCFDFVLVCYDTDKDYKTVRFIESWKTGKFSGFPKDDSNEELSKYAKNN
jgi:hypothetical protein